MWKNMVQPDWPHVSITRAYALYAALTNVKNTYSEYVILIAFPQ